MQAATGSQGTGTRMSVSLFVLGLMLTAMGGAMVGFGIPINEFGLGNTLIVAGTTAFVGGLVLVGLSDAVRQLRRIAESLMARPGPRMARPTEQFEPLAPATRNGPGPGRIPFPPKPEGRSRGPAAFEQRLAAAPSIDDDTPLSPREPSHVRMESRFSLMDIEIEPRGADTRSGLLGTEVLPISEFDAALRSTAPSGTSAQNETFESFWPAPPRSGSAPVEANWQTAETGAGEDKEPAKEPREAQLPAEPYAVSILKSGVVDGMAYTLYSDGSIEAEMPQGTMRFASITELRAYLDKSS